MTPAEIEGGCKKAVAERDGNPTMDYVTILDENTGRIIKIFKVDQSQILYKLNFGCKQSKTYSGR